MLGGCCLIAVVLRFMSLLEIEDIFDIQESLENGVDNMN